MSLREVVQALVLLACGLGVGFQIGRDTAPAQATAAPTGSAPMATAPSVPLPVPPSPDPARPLAVVPAAPETPAEPETPYEPAIERQPWQVNPTLLGPNTETLPEAVRRRLPNTPHALAGIPLIGDVQKARVAMTLFGDFQCQYTKDAVRILDEVMTKYGDEIVLGFRHLPLDFHDRARPAARAALAAADQEKFWPYARKLFDNQKALSDAQLRGYAVEIGLDLVKFDTAIAAKTDPVQLEVDKLVAGSIEADGTPTLLVNGYRLAGIPAAAGLDRIVEMAIAEVRGYENEGAPLIQARGKACDRAATRMSLKSKPNTEVENLRRLPLVGLPRKGAADPLVGIVVFSDFQCKPCAGMAKRLDTLLSKHPEEVAVAFQHYPLPIHDNAESAAVAAVFARDHGKFWEMHDRLFASQHALDRGSLVGHVTALGLDPGLFEKALAAKPVRDAIEDDRLTGNLVGVVWTPTVFINGRLVGEGGTATDEQLETAFEEAKTQAAAVMDDHNIKREGFYEALMALIPRN